ncbi:hypothetical protein FRC09_004983 [Ceratobasidium sp. 395]|nr:hypothetical protein FRC09_004983 [Ceratobasidium sp. 395]
MVCAISSADADVAAAVEQGIITSGCKIKRLKNAQFGLINEELQDRIADDPPLPWRSGLIKVMDDSDNEFWVKNILYAAMANEKARKLVVDVDVVERFWTRKIVRKQKLGPMWNSVRKEVLKKVDNSAAEQGRVN